MVVKSLEDITKATVDDIVTFQLKSLDVDADKLFLIIRNLSFPVENVKIDFSDVDVDQWVERYLETDIKVEILDFVSQLVDRLDAFINGFLGKDFSRYPTFICHNSDKLSLICNFCMSSIYYAVQLHSKKQQKFAAIVNESIPVNAIYVLKQIKSFEKQLCQLKQDIKFYTAEFIDENSAVFVEVLKNSQFGIMLYGSTTPEWKTFVNLMQMLNNVN